MTVENLFFSEKEPQVKPEPEQAPVLEDTSAAIVPPPAKNELKSEPIKNSQSDINEQAAQPKSKPPLTATKSEPERSSFPETKPTSSPKWETRHEDDKSTSVSMTFGDGQKFAFKYSPSVSRTRSTTTSVKPENIKQEHAADTASAASTSNRRMGRGPTRRKPRARSKSMTPEIASTLCDKTAAIRAMFAEVEDEHDIRLKARLTPSAKSSLKGLKARMATKSAVKIGNKIHAKGTVPDWNKIHSEQLFQRQPDLAQWHRERQARTERLFSGTAVARTTEKGAPTKSALSEARQRQRVVADKMSTPAFRSRSKSLVGKRLRTHNSEKTAKKHAKKVTIAPSTNDLKLHKDNKSNVKVKREATPYKHSETERLSLRQKQKNKRASAKARFGMTALTEEDGIAEEEEETESVEAVKSSTAEKETTQKSDVKVSEEKKVVKVPREKLAYDPDKIKSRLFESTSAMKGKVKAKSVRGSATPQVRSNSKTRKKTVGRGSATPQVRSTSASRRVDYKADYSAVKSKLDTGRRVIGGNKKTGDAEASVARMSGLKRRLIWKANGSEAGEADSSEPAQKKRKMSTKKGWL